MEYPKEFIEAVKKCYPNSNEIISLAQKGSTMLGRWLDDSCSDSLPIDLILRATSLGELKTIATKAKEKVDIKNWWNNIYESKI